MAWNNIVFLVLQIVWTQAQDDLGYCKVAQQRSTTQRCSGTGLCWPAWGWDAGDGHSAAQGNYKTNTQCNRHTNTSHFWLFLDLTENLLPTSNWLSHPVIALWGGGEPAEPGVSGEGAAYCDGGMSDGGQDGMEEGPHWAGGEPPADSRHKRHISNGQELSCWTALLPHFWWQ